MASQQRSKAKFVPQSMSNTNSFNCSNNKGQFIDRDKTQSKLIKLLNESSLVKNAQKETQKSLASGSKQMQHTGIVKPPTHLKF